MSTVKKVSECPPNIQEGGLESILAKQNLFRYEEQFQKASPYPDRCMFDIRYVRIEKLNAISLYSLKLNTNFLYMHSLTYLLT